MQLVFFVFGKHVIIIIIIALIQVDQKRRNSDGIRSTSFLKDEDNTSIAITPSKDGGYVGCYVDTEEDRDMTGSHTFNTHSSVSSCRSFCQLYLFFGLQGGSECYCSNEFGSHGRAQEHECSMPCKQDSNSSQTCGVVLRNSVHRTVHFPYKYVGCFRDNTTDRDLNVLKPANSDPLKCQRACSSYKYFGLQSSGKCYCGNSYGKYGAADESSCDMNCLQDFRFTCGGALTNRVFSKVT